MEKHNNTSNVFDDAILAMQRAKTIMEGNNRVMTCGEAAFHLKKTPQTISRYIAEGKLHRASGNGVNGVLAREVYKLMQG